MMKHSIRTFCAVAILGVASYSPLQAATTTTTMGVSMTITAGCTVTATPMAFGTAQVLGANVDATATVSPTCTNTTPYTVSLDIGTGATVTARKMAGPAGATIDYVLYRDASRTQVWGATAGSDTVAGTGNGSAQAITVYGRVPAQSSPAPGSYADVVTATVTY